MPKLSCTTSPEWLKRAMRDTCSQLGVEVCVTELVRYLQKMFPFPVRRCLVTEKTVFRRKHISTFSRWNFSSFALAHSKLSKENIPDGLPLLSPCMAIDLQTFSGFWLFIPLRKGRVWLLRLAVGRKAAQRGSHTPWCGCKDSCTSARQRFAVWYPGRLLVLSGVPAWSSSSWQRSSILKTFLRAALHAQQSLFTCALLSSLGFVPYIAMNFVLSEAAWFWSKPWT